MKRSLFKTIAPWMLGLAGGVLVLVGTSRAFDWPVATKTAATTQGSVPVAVNDTPLDRDPRLGNSFAPVVKKLAPSATAARQRSGLRLSRGGRRANGPRHPTPGF